MVKIKQKKQLNLPQLIEWVKENDVKDTVFLTKAYSIGFDMHGFIYFNSSTTIPLDTMFTVEVEEEITEDTRLDELVIRYRNDDIYIFPQERINDFKNDSSIVAFYIPNDDLTLTLIWTREKGLVK